MLRCYLDKDIEKVEIFWMLGFSAVLQRVVARRYRIPLRDNYSLRCLAFLSLD